MGAEPLGGITKKPGPAAQDQRIEFDFQHVDLLMIQQPAGKLTASAEVNICSLFMPDAEDFIDINFLYLNLVSLV